MRAIYCILLTLGLVYGAFAEMRDWTNSKGRSVSAELVNITEDTVTLRSANGGEHIIQRSDLSSEDQKYLLEQEKIQGEPQEKKPYTVSISGRKICLPSKNCGTANSNIGSRITIGSQGTRSSVRVRLA